MPMSGLGSGSSHVDGRGDEKPLPALEPRLCPAELSHGLCGARLRQLAVQHRQHLRAAGHGPAEARVGHLRLRSAHGLRLRGHPRDQAP